MPIEYEYGAVLGSDIDYHGLVVSVEGFNPERKYIVVHGRDWHGAFSLSFPADMPKAERQRREAIARAIHGPDSQEACCVKKRERLAALAKDFIIEDV